MPISVRRLRNLLRIYNLPTVVTKCVHVLVIGRMNVQGEFELRRCSLGQFDKFSELVGLHSVGFASVLDRSVRPAPGADRCEAIEGVVCVLWGFHIIPLIEHYWRTGVPPGNVASGNYAVRRANVTAHGEIESGMVQARAGITRGVAR